MDLKRSARLAELFEAYGADPARWPPEERPLATEMGDLDVSEAREIDAVLSHAGRPVIDPSARMAAMTRIMSATGMPRPTARPAQRRAWGAWGPVATALAASFALGIYLGSAGLIDDLMPQLSLGTDTAMIQDLDVTGVADVTDLIEGESS